ncbi:MAG TPA: pyridoxine 5'-phosphate synthase [Polyangiaceae bacterium]|nr:pyridoxine 5'-phosphate synthase [Polyangiaceae bacterium]
MTKLSVNVNKIATLRNTRQLGIPSVVQLSELALKAGAQGITVHPRPDERHIRSHDVDELALLLVRYPAAEYNIEGNPFHGLVDHCRRARPAQATLVPDAREAFTSNHGWNLVELGATERRALASAVAELHACGCRVSLFVDPVPEIMPIARDVGADRVELYTEPYAAAFTRGEAEPSVALYAAAARAAHDVGLGVNAGHDLNLDNLSFFAGRVEPLDEVSIGHALIADALQFGLEETVKRYLKRLVPLLSAPSVPPAKLH